MAKFEQIASFGDYNEYSYTSLKFGHTEEELREEYKAFRKEAKERYKKLRESEFSDSKLLHGKSYLRQSPKKMTKSELARNLSDMAKFVHSKLSTVKGQQQQLDLALRKWETRGYADIINRETYKEFAHFMDNMGSYVVNKVLTSDDLVGYFTFAKENNISVINMERNFKFYSENMNDIETLNLNANRKRKYTANELKKIMEKRRVNNDIIGK